MGLERNCKLYRKYVKAGKSAAVYSLPLSLKQMRRQERIINERRQIYGNGNSSMVQRWEDEAPASVKPD